MRLEIIASALLYLVVGEASDDCPIKEIYPYCHCWKTQPYLYLFCQIWKQTDLLTISESKYNRDISILSIHLYGMDNVPPSALQYSNLTELTIRGKDLTSVTNGAFRGLEDTLRKLYFSHTSLVKIPAAVISGLRMLRCLEIMNSKIVALNVSLKFLPFNSLNFYNNNISVIHRDIFPYSLQVLDLNDNKLESLNGSLRGSVIQALIVLRISNNNIRSLKGELDDTQSLLGLYAKGNMIQNIEYDSLATLTKLRVLDLSHNRIKYIDRGLLQLRDLRQLYLSDNGMVYLELKALSNLHRLHELNLSHNNFLYMKDGALDCLPLLRILDIQSNYFFIDLRFLHMPSIYNGLNGKPIRRSPNCTFRENPKLESLKMQNSGVKCTYANERAILYLESLETKITGNPCELFNRTSK